MMVTHVELIMVNDVLGMNIAYGENAAFAVGENDIYYSQMKCDASKCGDTLVFVERNAKPKVTYQIMHSHKTGNTWSKGEPIPNKDINEDGYIVGNGTFNPEMTRFYFTKCLEM